MSFTDDVDEASINTDNIKLTTSDNVSVPVSLSPSDAPFTYNLTIDDWLEYDSEYFLKFKNISNSLDRKMNKTISLKTKEFTTKLDFGELSYSSGTVNIPIFANISGDVKAAVIVMVCDGTEDLYCVKSLGYLNCAVNTESEEAVEISVPSGMKTPFIKVMAVDNMNDIKMYAKPAAVCITQ